MLLRWPDDWQRSPLPSAARYSSMPLAMFQLDVIAAPAVPSAFCGVYSYLNRPKFSVTFSVSRVLAAAAADGDTTR